MPLPTIEKGNYENIPLPSGKKIGVTRWRVKEEKELLYATEGSKDINFINEEIVKMLSRCVDDTEKFAKLSDTDVLFLATQLRKMSKGEEIEIVWNCSKCKAQNEGIVNLNTAVDVRPFKAGPHEVGKYAFTFRELSQIDEAATSSKFEKNSEANFALLCSSIEAVTENETLFNHFSKKEMEDFLDSLPVNDLKLLWKKFTESRSYVAILQKMPCAACKQEISVYVENLTDFFAF